MNNAIAILAGLALGAVASIGGVNAAAPSTPDKASQGSPVDYADE